MATSTLVQSGIELFAVAEDGSSTELTVPSTVTITEDRPPRFEVNGVYAVLTNTPTEPLIVDDAGIVMFLSPIAPTVAPTVAVGAAGALTGTYYVKYTYVIRTLDGVTVAESGYSPTSAAVVLTADKLAVSALDTLDGLTTVIDPRYEIIRRLYRTTNGTLTFFQWGEVEDNTTTTFEDDATDASLSAIAAPVLGTAPFLSNIASFRDRLFGVNDSENREMLLYSEAGRRWAWPSDNFFPVPQRKGDSQSGITSLMPRREALGIAKSGMLLQLTGTDDDDFRIVVLSTTIGALNQESVASYRDDVFFLAFDGVYRWGESGLTCVSDGRVRSWFTTDDYFNRSLFDEAFAKVEPISKSYRLYLAAAGSTTIDTWIELNLETFTWWGPHRSDAYVFSSTLTLASTVPLIGGGTTDGFISVETADRSDDEDTAIETEAIMAPIKAVDPPETAYWGMLNPEVAPQAAGTLSIYPTVGEPDDAEDTVFSHDITTASISLGRLGYGRYMFLRFYHNTISQVLQILGFEVNPLNIVGNRQ